MRKYQLIEWKNGTAIERIESDLAADGAQIERDDHEREIAEETGQYDTSVGLGRGGTDWE